MWRLIVITHAPIFSDILDDGKSSTEEKGSGLIYREG